MAMLAEPKQKQRWCLNPRGSLWSQDETKLGQRLLEKMGWSKGKGLGKHEDGNPDHIRVSYKNDSRGMGFKGYDDAWVAHQDDFNALLTSLHKTMPDQDNNATAVELKNLEEKSLKSKKRVHYHKFIRGKDLSKRSAKDLQCIFGKRDPLGKEKPVEELQVTGEADHEKNANVPNGSSYTIDSGSMQLYFAQKIAKLRNRSKLGTVQENQNSADDETTKLKKVNNSNGLNGCETENVIAVGERLSKKKRKQELVVCVDESSSITKKVCEVTAVEEPEQTSKTKNKKKRKDKLIALDDSHENAVSFNSAEDNGNTSLVLKRSKKKRKLYNHLEHSENGASCLQEATTNNLPLPVSKVVASDTPIVYKKKKERKRRHENALEPYDSISRVNERSHQCNVIDNASTNNSVALDSISQTDVVTMRNTTLDLMRHRKKKKKDEVGPDVELTLKDAAVQQMNSDSGKIINVKKSTVNGDMKIKSSSDVSNKLSDVAKSPPHLCDCQSGYGAYDRLPWEIINSLGYFRKTASSENKYLVECMRERKVFKNSNIFKIRGYEVLPSFDCCCNKL